MRREYIITVEERRGYDGIGTLGGLIIMMLIIVFISIHASGVLQNTSFNTSTDTITVENAINVYACADDAQNEVNVVVQYGSGTYTIDKRYGEMVHISGVGYDGWINPKEI